MLRHGQIAAPKAMVLVSVFLVVGCGRTEPRHPQNPKIGTDTCAECSMVLSDARTAGALLTERDGKEEYLLYDDLGCMLDTERAPHDFKILERWVTDFGRSEWIGAEKAVYVSSPSVRTPMGSGIVAFVDLETARKLGVGFRVFTWAEIQSERKNSMESRFGKPPG